MIARGRFQGVLSIARFNRPFYAAATALLIGSVLCLALLNAPVVRMAAVSVCLAAGYFVFGSLGVSHLIYDRSGLYRLDWVTRALGGTLPAEAIFCHAGFDETSVNLEQLLRPARWKILDHHDEVRMTEPSIQRARRMYPPTPETLKAPFDHWPIADGSADAVFAILAIHEFRRDAERRDWFSEARRSLRPDGRVIVAEHLRDWANFVAFGPGFLHFHSRRAWQTRGARPVLSLLTSSA